MEGLMNKYKELEFTLVTDLTRVMDLAKELELNDISDILKEEIVRIKDKNFKVIVVGDFKRGKSTLINALLKRQVLPADIVPTTATINRVAYAPEPHVNLSFKDGSTEEIEIGQLSDYVTKLTPAGEAVAATLAEAIIYFPTPFCQNHICIIDTPGLSDDAAMTKITIDAMDKADAAIMVISALSPFSERERDFVTSLLLTSSTLCRLIFVVNFIDMVEENEVDRLLAFARNRIISTVNNEAEKKYKRDTIEYNKITGIMNKAPIFGVASYLAVEARRSNDPAKLMLSRFQPFEEELENILASEQGLSSIKIPLKQMITSCDNMLTQMDKNLIAEEERSQGKSYKEFLNSLQEHEKDMQQCLDKYRGISQLYLGKLNGLCNNLKSELFLKETDCINRIGINNNNFYYNVINSYFNYINTSIDECHRKVFNIHSVIIQREIIQLFNEAIGMLTKSYENIIDIAEGKNINFKDKLEKNRKFTYYLSKHPFPICKNLFRLPTNIGMTNFDPSKIIGISDGYCFKNNIGAYIQREIKESVDNYRKEIVTTSNLILKDITDDYLSNYEKVEIQFHSDVSNKEAVLMEKYSSIKKEYRRKRNVLTTIRYKSSWLLDNLQNENQLWQGYKDSCVSPEI